MWLYSRAECGIFDVIATERESANFSFLEENTSFKQKWMSEKKYYKCANIVVAGILWRYNIKGRSETFVELVKFKKN